MRWNNDEDYIEYQSSLCNLKNILGLNKINYIVRPELAPYLTRILQNLEQELIRDVGINGKVEDKIKFIFDLFDRGADLIVTGFAKELANSIEGLQDESEEDPIKYDQEKFIFSWTNIMTTLTTTIRFQYSHILVKPLIPDCPCDCTRGDSQETWDNYFSGVWPEDEGNKLVTEEQHTRQNRCTCSYRSI